MGMELITGISVFLFIITASVMLISKPKSQKPYERIYGDREYVNYESEDKNLGFRERFRKKVRERRSHRETIKKISKTQDLINKSDVTLEIEEFIILRLGLGALGAIIFGLVYISNGFTPNEVLMCVIMMIAFSYIPVFNLRIKKNKRNKMFSDQLGDAIGIFSNSIKAGYSFLQAVNSVSREMPYPVSKEFGLLLKEMSLGIDSDQALKNMTSRIESDDLELMITAILIQRETGGNLSEILDNISDTIRERIKIKGEVRTLTAQGKMSGIIVGIIPLVLGVVIYFLNKEYMMTLFTTTPGRIAVAVAFVNEMIGAFVISRIIKIDF